MAIAAASIGPAAAEEPINISGVYPHLRMWNGEGECGTGAVVMWQGDLWAITYAPHQPGGSSDKLYRVTPDLEQIIFEGSVGGTPANRMIHRETQQLLIGPYLINAEKSIRVIPPTSMYGRLTGNARHLSDPASKVYYATMEEGLYEVDVNTLEVKCLIRDGNGGGPKGGLASELPGYHGKGLFSGQGRLVYANNGDRGPKVTVDPTVPSGALAQWFGEGDWQLVRRNQFTEVSGPGGIEGNADPESEVIWAMGWDAKSLILALLEDKKWHYYRLPKGSHSYDGAHGWNTEWPRIREIGEGDDLLATMHGTFWKFPAGFSRQNSAGIAPRSNYLKVIGDFCRWGDRVVLGCDDSAKAEFLNTRSFKAAHGAPKQSNSNLWFVAPERLDDLGPVIGRGAVWLRDEVESGEVSDAYLFSGYDHRQLHLAHQADQAVIFSLQVDREGTNRWEPLRDITVPAGELVSHRFEAGETGAWIRLKAGSAASGVTAHFQYRDRDRREGKNNALFAGLATVEKPAATTGVMRSLAYDRLGLVASSAADSRDFSYYEINPQMELVPVNDPAAAIEMASAVRQPEKSISEDAASVLLIEDGKRYRLPKNDRYAKKSDSGAQQPERSGKRLSDFLGESLALKADVTVSSTHEAYAAEHAVDGKLDDETARWISTATPAGWIELDLGEAKTFRSLWVVTGWNKDSQFVARNFDVQVKVGDQWQTLPGGEVRGNHKVEFGIELEEAVTASQLRVAALNTGFFRVYEIALFEQAPDIEAARFEGFGPARICREVATERDLLNVHGTFYELPARNAQGLAKARAISTHNLAIQDFCSHNGLLLFTGIDADTTSEHIFRSEDGKAAVWAGVIDDLWKLGKARGVGGPWKDSRVKAGQPSDPYLMTGFDKKSVTLSAQAAANITLQVDLDGTGLWADYRSFEIEAGEAIEHEFPEGYSAYWVRAISNSDTVATVQFRYE